MLVVDDGEVLTSAGVAAGIDLLHLVRRDHGSGTADTRTWALARLDEPLTLAGLVAHARMSVRTSTRRFREETGLSRQRWLTQQRVELARRLPESTDTPVERVAAGAGFGTTLSLRQHLHAAVGAAPPTYRRPFRGTPDVISNSSAAAR